MTVLESVLRDFKFELPSTAVKSLEVTKKTISKPEATLEKLIQDHAHQQKDLHLEDVAAFAERFKTEHGITLRIQKRAAQAIAKEAEQSGKTVNTVCERLFKDYPYGLGLIQKETGKKSFSITPAMLKDPDGALSEMVTELYQEEE